VLAHLLDPDNGHALVLEDHHQPPRLVQDHGGLALSLAGQRVKSYARNPRARLLGPEALVSVGFEDPRGPLHGTRLDLG
jgi:hypothetical protein